MANFKIPPLKKNSSFSISIVRVGFLVIIMMLLSFSPYGVFPSQGKESLSISGITEPIDDVTLNSTIVGTISVIFVKEGMTVKKGETILDLDKKLEELEVVRRKAIWEGKAELEAAEARVSTLQSLLESTREVFMHTGSISKEELQKLELEYKLAAAEKKRLDNAEVREGIEYEMAQESLRKRSLLSPIEGTIIKLFLEEGETCQENQPLVRVVDAGRCVFVGNAEEWIGRTLKSGQTVDLKIKTGSDYTAKKGRIVFVSPVVDPASGLLEVKAEFDNKDGSVRPGVAGFMLLRGR